MHNMRIISQDETQLLHTNAETAFHGPARRVAGEWWCKRYFARSRRPHSGNTLPWPARRWLWLSRAIRLRRSAGMRGLKRRDRSKLITAPTWDRQNTKRSKNDCCDVTAEVSISDQIIALWSKLTESEQDFLTARLGLVKKEGYQ